MKNVQIEVKGQTLTLTIDLTQTQGPSSSGKTLIVASTGGQYQRARARRDQARAQRLPAPSGRPVSVARSPAERSEPHAIHL